MTDFIIIGAGIIGLLTAKELVDAGAKVLIFDQYKLGSQASWAGGGIISPLYPWRHPDSITQASLWSDQYYPTLCAELLEETGIDPEWTQSGLLCLSCHDFEKALEWGALNKASVIQLSNNQFSNYQEGLNILSEESLWFQNVAQIRNPRLLKALKQYLVKKNNIKIVEQTQVTEVLFKGNRALGVQTDLNAFFADAVILATGAWTENLLPTENSSIAIKPAKGQMLLFGQSTVKLKTIVLADGKYLIPRKDGQILVGSTLEYTGFNNSISTEGYDSLYRAALNMLPGLSEVTVVKHWAGLRPESKSGLPYIGLIPQYQNFYINSGHFRNGLLLAPGSARLLADQLLDREPFMSIDIFSP